MKDRSLIWMAVGGMLLWVFFGVPAARSAMVHAARACWREVVGMLS